MADNFLKISSGINLTPQSGTPTSPANGDIWYDLGSNSFKSRANGTTTGLGGTAIGSTITGATTGSIFFAGTSSVLAQDNANLFWADSTNRLGIGTATPSYKLHSTGAAHFGEGTGTMAISDSFIAVNGAGVADQGYVIGQNGVNKWFIANRTSGNYLLFSTTIIDAVTITPTGDVGIGVTPVEQLQITGNFRIPASTSTVGQIKQGSSRIFHSFGTNNLFLGVAAGNFTMTGSGGNTVVGNNAFTDNTTGIANTVMGSNASQGNTTGGSNASFGHSALNVNTTGGSNAAFGRSALQNNDTGSDNVAVGRNALLVVDASSNTAIGKSVLDGLTSGSANTVVGKGSGAGIVTGSNNTILGANVTGLSSSLASNIILANGAGTIKAQHDGTDWTLTGNVHTVNQGELRLRELIANGTDYVAIRAPATLAASYTLTLPADDGTTGQVLSTDGSGVLSWITASGSSDIDIGTTDITNGTPGRILYENGSNVVSEDANLYWFDMDSRLSIAAGTSPLARLHVASNGMTVGQFDQNSTSPNDVLNVKITDSANTSGRHIVLFNPNGNELGIRVPETGLTSYTITLPPAQGAFGDVLTNDGTGELAWSPGGGTVDLQQAYDNGFTITTSSFPVTINGNQGINVAPTLSNSYGLAVTIADAGGFGQGVAISIESQSYGLLVEQDGTGAAAQIRNQNGTTGDVIQAYLQSGGVGMVLDAQHDGNGRVISIVQTNSGNSDSVVYIEVAGESYGIDMQHNGEDGYGINVNMINTNNGSAAIFANHQGQANTVVFQAADENYYVLELQHGAGAGGLMTLKGATSGAVAIFVPNSITDYSITLPDDQGSAGQVLVNTAGDGVLNWATPGGGPDVVIVSSNISGVSGKTYLINTSAARTITLPAPALNAYIVFKDMSGTASTNNITIAQNAVENIEGQAASYVMSTDWGAITLISDGADWFIL